jgi:ligand-binding sensor domain-containing protein/signal transduction histidine kinase
MSRNGFKRQIVVFPTLLILVTFSIEVVFALDPKKAITQYVHDVWTTEDGLPQNSTLCIAQTSDGYLWLGTWGGLARFDGVRFTVFDRGNTREITSNFIVALHVDYAGNLWIGTTGGGLIRFRDGRFTTYTTVDGLSHNGVRSIYEDRRGNLWIGTDGGGLSRFRDGNFTSFTSKEGLSSDWVYSVYEDHQGVLWVGTANGLNRFENGEFTRYPIKKGLSNYIVWSISEDREKGLWVGTSVGLYKFKGGEFTRYTSKEGLSHRWAYSIYNDHEGNLWVGTDGGGLNRFQDKKFASFTTKDGLSHNTVSSIYEDREGSLWVGTWGGLSRLKDGKFTVYAMKEGLSHDWTRSVYEDREGSLWVGTYGGGLNRLKGDRFTRYTTSDGLSGVIMAAIYGDSSGNLWCPTEDGGLCRLRNGMFTRHYVKPGTSAEQILMQTNTKPIPAHERVASMYEDRQGNLWLGTFDGVVVWRKDGNIAHFSTKDGLSHKIVTTIREDRQGSFWLGTERGLNRFRNGRFTHYPTKHGLSHITSIYEDGEGSIFVTTRGDGLIRFKDEKVTTYTTAEGLFDNVLTVVMEDGKENLWLGSFRGIFSMRKKELDDVAHGRKRVVESISYGTADGMRNVECNSQQPPGWKSRDGRLWFPTVKGLVMIDPDHLKLNTLAPPVFIEQVNYNKKPVSLAREAELPPDRRELEFHFTALSFLDPKKVRFKYRLEGYDKDWVDAGTRRVVYYTNLSYGPYRIRVIACNNDGVWNESGAAFDLYLRPYFYETPLFYVPCIALFGIILILMGIGGHHLRVRQLRAREESERMADYGRMVAGVAHDIRKPMFALRAAAYVVGQMVNGQGDVQSRLNAIERITGRISSLMDDLLYFAEPKTLRLAPTDITNLMREAVEIYREEYDETFPEIVQRSTPGLPLIAVDRNWMVRVIVNLIENAAKHAYGITLVTLSAEPVPDLAYTHETPSEICIRVANDGKGIESELLPKIFKPFFSTGQGTGLGLAVVDEIIRRHDGTITVESHPSSGSAFIIRLPATTKGKS